MPGPQWAKLSDWKTLAQKGEAPADTALLKSYVAEVKADGDARTVEFTISTGAVDRDRDIIAVDGWKLTAFRRNPVIQWAHDYTMPPIARATKIRVDGNSLKATAEFAPAEVYPFAETIFQLIKGGFLKATSVGFRPLKHAFNAERGGMDFMSQELLEFSLVPVPANADCLMEGKAAGIDVAPLETWAKAVLARKAPACSRGKDCPKGEHDECPMGEDCPMAGKAASPVFQGPGMIEAPVITGFKVVVRKPETMPPDGEGHCPAGYEMGGDGMCHEKAKTAERVLVAPSLTADQVRAIVGEAVAPLAAKLEALTTIPDPDVLTLDAEEPDTLDGLTPADVRAAFAETLHDAINGEVRSAINALRGRVD